MIWRVPLRCLLKVRATPLIAFTWVRNQWKNILSLFYGSFQCSQQGHFHLLPSNSARFIDSYYSAGMYGVALSAGASSCFNLLTTKDIDPECVFAALTDGYSQLVSCLLLKWRLAVLFRTVVRELLALFLCSRQCSDRMNEHMHLEWSAWQWHRYEQHSAGVSCVSQARPGLSSKAVSYCGPIVFVTQCSSLFLSFCSFLYTLSLFRCTYLWVYMVKHFK